MNNTYLVVSTYDTGCATFKSIQAASLEAAAQLITKGILDDQRSDNADDPEYELSAVYDEQTSPIHTTVVVEGNDEYHYIYLINEATP